MTAIQDAFTGPPAAWQESDNGLVAANMDPLLAQIAGITTAGTVYLVKLPLRGPVTITNLIWGMTVAGVGASTGSFSGLISPAGQLLTGSADIGALLTGAAGPVPVPMTTPQLCQPPFVWGTILTNLATTQPTLARGQAIGGIPNVNLPNAQLRFAINGTGATVLPASIVPTANAGPSGGTYLLMAS
jgi:hypothetical protein